MLHASSRVPFPVRCPKTCQKSDDNPSAERFAEGSAVFAKHGHPNRQADIHAVPMIETATGTTVVSQASRSKSSSGLITNHEANNLTVDTQVNCSNLSNAPQNQTRQNKNDLVSNHFHNKTKQNSSSLQLRQLQKRLQQQEQLRTVEYKLRDSLNLSTIFGVAVVESAQLFDAQQVILLEYHAEEQAWELVSQYCHNQDIAWQKRCRLVKEEFPDLTRQLLQGEPLRIFHGQPLPTTETRQWLACQPGNWVLLPVSTEPNQVANSTASKSDTTPSTDASHWGVLALALPEPLTWTTDDIACAQNVTGALAAAISNATQYQSLLVANVALQKLALSDGLTGLANRRRFDEHLADEWQRLARDRQPLSLILCDLDHFKRYNDNFGHPAGDRCLAKVANALRSGPQRPADLVARYGGEEFAIVLPNTDTKGAWRIAQKIHNSIRSLKIPHVVDEKKPHVTVTMGISTIIPGHDATAQILIQAADLALYHAKKQGRDRTYVHAHYNTVSIESQTDVPNGDEAQLDMTPPEAS